ncbi:hypothetical protein QEN58_14270 [Halomonas alkaliantarctica]|uniref:Uncharacterized protein n=1 Tax=Halomonas alkaliantarctica TaxID=232346 RepID=A0ABY8LJ61_9GAMM|nr:hypothetical protein [Halomonas alkaliantarctica]WGI24490.1 hypothetical protein QEN58_14270 [Halomonas alkaliantarctica]
MISSDHESINKLAYENALNSLSMQRSSLTSLRQRSVAITTLSGLSATFLGKEALLNSKRGDLLCLDIVLFAEGAAITFLVIALLCSIELLRPRKDWVFYNRPSEIINQFSFGDNVATLSETYVILSIYMEEHYSINLTQLSRMYYVLNIAIASCFLQIICWFFSLIL